MGKPLDLQGCRFGRLKIVSQAANKIMPNGDSRRAWFCECDCGNTIVVTTRDLQKGDVKSCGCLKREVDKKRNYLHGEHGSHLHNVWVAMRRRCANKKNADYHRYGGRGISVCAEWQDDYIAFRDWAISNGYSSSLTIDRIDVNGDYSPENCRWVTMKDQCNNRSNNAIICSNGISHTISEWAEIVNLPYTTLYMRFRNGWDAERALYTPKNTV